MKNKLMRSTAFNIAVAFLCDNIQLEAEGGYIAYYKTAL